VTCKRNENKGEASVSVREELHREFALVGVKINLTEASLDKNQIAKSCDI